MPPRAPPGRAAGILCRDPRLFGETRDTILDPQGRPCGIAAPVRVERVDGVALRPAAVLGCPTARRLADWVSGVVKPAARRHLAARADALRIYGSYVCRTRNHRPGAKISEHGRGRAVDIGAVLLAGGGRVSVEADWGEGPSGRFLAEIREGACGPFTTVLGPGSDPFHDTHLHLDTAPRGSTWCK